MNIMRKTPAPDGISSIDFTTKEGRHLPRYIISYTVDEECYAIDLREDDNGNTELQATWKSGVKVFPVYPLLHEAIIWFKIETDRLRIRNRCESLALKAGIASRTRTSHTFKLGSRDVTQLAVEHAYRLGYFDALNKTVCTD